MKRVALAIGGIAGVAWVAVGLAGCERDASSPPATSHSAPLPPATAPSAASRPPAPPSAADMAAAQVFAANIDAAMAKGDVQPLVTAIDVHAVLDRALEGLPITDDMRRSIEAKNTQEGFWPMMNELVASGGTYRLLRVHEMDGELRARFRLTGAGGLNYHDLVLRIDPAGQVRVVDFEIAITGEMYSQTVRRVEFPRIVHQGRLTAPLAASVADFVKHCDALAEIRSDANSRQYAEADVLYRSLPEALRNDRMIMLVHVTASKELGPTAYLAAVDQYAKAFANLPSAKFVQIDALLARQKWNELFKVVDELDQLIGGDPYLNFYHACGLMAQGDLAAGRAALEKGLSEDPAMVDFYVMLLRMACQQKDWSAAVAVEERLVKAIGKYYPATGELAEFGASAEFKAWRAKHPEIQ